MQMTRFLVAVGAVAMIAAGAAAEGQAQVQKPGPGVVLPQVVRDVKPQYTAGAMKERIQGNVVLEVVVKADGTVGDTRITRSLDTVHGLDEQALKAVKQWVFKPGTKDGKAVPVMVEIEMTFKLK